MRAQAHLSGARVEKACVQRLQRIDGGFAVHFDDGREPLRAGKGEAFMLPPAPLGGGAHSGRNPSQRPTRLFLIDDAPGDTPEGTTRASG